MLEYNDIKMELVSIDRFERSAVSSEDGVNHLWNEYTIQVTALVHYAYLGAGSSPFVNNIVLKNKLLEKRKKFKFSFLTGGAASQSNAIASGAGFAEVGVDKNFVFSGPTPNDISQKDIVPDYISAYKDGESGESEILIESPPEGYSIDAHNGPDPIFCHVTEFIGGNGFAVTWAVKTWLVDCPNDASLLPLVDNRFDQLHDVDDDQVTTITTYGTAVFRTDLLYKLAKLPDDFRCMIIAPIYLGFRRSHIQVKQMSDTTVKYLTMDKQTPVVFDPSVPNAVRAEVIHHRLLYQQEEATHSFLQGMQDYYQFRSNRGFAEQDKKDNRLRADEMHRADIDVRKSADALNKAKARYYRRKGRP